MTLKPLLTLIILLAASSARAQPTVLSSDAPVSHPGVDETAAQIEAFVDERPASGSTLVSPVIVEGHRPSQATVDDSPWGQGFYTQVAPGVDAEKALATPSAAPPDAPRRIHGEVSVGFGTHGLRTASAAAVIPVGADATLAIAVSSARFGR